MPGTYEDNIVLHRCHRIHRRNTSIEREQLPAKGVELGLGELGDDRQATDRWQLPPVADVEDEDDGDEAACPELACFGG